MIKAVVFDLDDTLYLECDYVRSGYEAVAEEILKLYGIDGAYDDLLRLFNEKRNNVFNRYLQKKNLQVTHNAINHLVNIYRSHKPSIKLADEVKQVLIELRNKSYKIGIITDGRPESQRAKISALGLNVFVDEIIITDELGSEEYRKPNPRAYELIATKFGITLDEMMYVGDNPQKDFAIGNLGVVTVKYNSGGLYTECDYLYGVLPKNVINNFNDIVSLLGVN